MSDEEQETTPARSWRSRRPGPLRHGLTIFLALFVIEYLVIPKFVAASHAVALIPHSDVVFLSPDAPGVGTLVRPTGAAALFREGFPRDGRRYCARYGSNTTRDRRRLE